jgi:hypothetical protein
VFIPLGQIFGPESRPRQPWYRPSGYLVQLPVSGRLEARLDRWTPSDPNVELYIVKSPRSFPIEYLTCVSYEEPCTEALAADTDPGKKAGKATTDVLQPNEYGVGTRNTIPTEIEMFGEYGYYAAAVSVSTTSGTVAAPVIGRFYVKADGSITYEMYK